MKFRLHRGSLADSMATARTVDTKAEFDHALREIVGDGAELATVKVTLYDAAPDTRIGWNQTYVVATDRGVVGFTDGPLETLS